MSQNIIDVGSAPNDGTGDPLRNAFIAINENFDQIWNNGPVNSNVKIANNTITTTNINGNLVLAPSGIGVTQVKSSVIPSIDNVYDLGSPNLRFNSIYLGSGGLELAGNLNVDYYYGNGRFLTGVLAAAAPNIVFGTTEVNIPGSNANVVFTVRGTQTIEVGNTQVNFFRPIESNTTISALGNITSAANINSSGITTNSASAVSLSISGNAVSGNLSVVGRITTPTISSAGNITLQPTGNLVFSNAVVNWLADPIQAQDAATKNYVDSVAQGLDVKASVALATAAVLPAYTYNNGNAGVGATITGTANAVLLIDGVEVTATSRVLIKNEIGSNQPYNGIYVVTSTGSASAPYVLTRSNDFDLPAEVPSAFTFVEGGNTNTDSGFVCITKSPVVFGSTNIVWQQFSGAGTYSAGPGLSLSGTQFFISNTGVTANTYGSSSTIPVLTVDIRGQITSATTSNINAPASLVTGSTLSANVLISSLTTVGTLSGLSVTGNVNTGNINTQAISVVGNVTSGNLNSAGQISATGNITANYFLGNIEGLIGNITNLNSLNLTVENISALVGNNGVNIGAGGFNNLLVLPNEVLIQNVPLTTVGNIIGGNITTSGLITATGNVTGANLNTVGILSAAGNVSAAGAVFSGNVSAVNFIGNISGNIDAAGANTQVQFNTNDILDASANFTFNKATNVMSVAGTITATTLSATGNVSALGKVSATGNVESLANINGANINASSNISATGNILGGNISSSGNTTALNLNASSIVSAVGNINTTANVNGGNIEVTGQITSIGNISSSGNIQGNNVFAVNLISSAGNVTGANITTDGFVTAVGNITSTANVIGGNIVTSGVVTATGNILSTANVNAANVNATNIISAVGNVIGGNISTAGIITATGNITSTANIAAGNIISTDLISATGNVVGGNVVTAGIANVGTLTVTGSASFNGNIAGNLNITGNVAGGNMLSPGLISATGNIVGGNLTTAGISNVGTLAVTGTTSLGGNVTSNLSVSSNIAAGNITTPGQISATGNITSSANISGSFVSPGANREMLFNSNGLISSSSLITFDRAGPTLTLTNTAGTIITAYVSSLGGTDLAITPATSNLVVWASTNPRFSNTYTLGTSTFQWRNIWGGNANIGALSVSGITNLTGNLSVAANISTGNISVTGNVASGNLLTTGIVSSTGNVSGGNITTAGRVDATGNVAGGNVTTTGRIDATGNVAGGNVTTIGDVSATGNVLGGNINTAGIVSATGNIVSSANIAGGNISLSGMASVVGNVNGGNVTSVGIISAAGNVLGANLSTTGNIDATGNIQGGNVLASNMLSATGNVVSAANVDGNNINSVNLISAVGNVVGGNLNTAGLVSATGNVVGGNITTAGIVTSTGNVVGGNINTAGLVSATGNVIGGNVTTAGNLSATGNVIGGNLVTAGNVVTNSVSGTNLTIYASANILISAAGNLINMGGHEVTNVGYPNSSTDAATKQYVDDSVSAGLHIHTPVSYETPSALPSATYAQGGNVFSVSATVANNIVVFSTAANLQVNDQLWFTNSFEGIVSNTSYFVISTPNTSAAVLSREYSGEPVANITSNTGLTQAVRVNSGIGATLTATANGALSVDGVAVSNSNRILVYNQANAVQNGVYVVSDTGNATAPWILTRATDSDQYVPDTNDGMDAGSYYYVTGGNTGAGESYVMTAPPGAYIIGYDNVQFTQFSSSQVYSANTQAGLSLVGTTFSAKVDNNTTAFDAGGNIKVSDTANLVTPNIGAATGTSLSLTGNVDGGNVNSGALVSAVGNIVGGNIITTGAVSATSNIVGGNLSTTGNATVGNLDTTGTISTTGNINAANVNTGFLNVNTLSGANISGNVNVVQITGQGGFLNATGANLTGNLTAGNTSLGNLVLTGNVTSNVNIDGNVSILNDVNIEANLTVDSILVDTVGGITANAGNVDINQITGLGGYLNATGANLSGNLTAGNTSISNLSLSGNITSNVNINGNVYIENDVNVEANLTVDSLLVDTVGGITANAGNIVINQITGQGGFLNAVGANLSGNLNAGNTAISNLSLSGNITSNVNIDGNVFIENAVNIEAPLTADSILVDTVGGITANSGNIDINNVGGFGGWLNATGANLSGNLIVNNISLTTQLSTAGNITAGYFIGDGSQLTNLIVAAGSQIINGNSNVSVAANGNVTVGTYGSIPATFANTGVYVTGLITASGNVSAAALDTVGNIVAGGNVNVTSNAVVTGNVSGGNISTTGNLSATGNVSGNYFLGNGALLTGIITSVANINNGTSNLRIDTANGDIQANVAGSANVFVITSTGIQTTGNISGNNLSISNIANVGNDLNVVGNIDVQGLITADGNVTALNLNTAGLVSATGNVIGGNVNAGGIVSATGNIITAANISGGNILSTLLISAAGNVSGANVTSNGVVTALGNVTGGNVNSDGIVSATGNIVTTANVQGGNLISTGIISATGNVSGNYFLGNGACLTGVITSVANINNGTSNLRIDTSGGNILANVGGTANVFIITSNGLETSGTFSATGNIVSTANVTGGNITTSGVVTASGNVTGGNITTAGLVTATGNIVSTANVTGGNLTTAGLVTATGNIVSTANVTGGNLTTSGLISASGNVTGGNLTTAGLVTATGNITSGANIQAANLIATANISATGNITGNYYIGNGSLLTGISAGGGFSTFSVVGNAAGYVSGNVTLVSSTTSGNLIPQAGNGIAMVGNATTNTLVISVLGSLNDGTIWGGGGDCELVSDAVVPPSYDNGAVADAPTDEYDLGELAEPGTTTTFSETAPADPSNGDMWIDSNSGTLYLYFNDGTSSQWAQMASVYSINESPDVSNIGDNIIPSANATYTLGNTSRQWSTAFISGNVNAGNLIATGIVSATGNISGNYILGNGALLTGVITSVANINNGTSNVNVVSSGGNVTVGVANVSNVAIFANSGMTVSNVQITGNIDGAGMLNPFLLAGM